jgi:hypothetical protein
MQIAKETRYSRLQQYITNDPTSHYYCSGFPFRVFPGTAKGLLIQNIGWFGLHNVTWCKALGLEAHWEASLIHWQHTAQAATFMQQVEGFVDVSQLHAVGNVLIHLDFLRMELEILVDWIKKHSSNT